jgi:hypothetical protein
MLQFMLRAYLVSPLTFALAPALTARLPLVKEIMEKFAVFRKSWPETGKAERMG